MSFASGSCGLVYAGVNPCYGAYHGTHTNITQTCVAGSQVQTEVTLGQTLNVTFGGSPPFNVSYTVKHPTGGASNEVFCNLNYTGKGSPIQQINSSSFSFTVQPYNFTAPNETATSDWILLQEPGDSIIFSAVQLYVNGSNDESNGMYPYFVSSNYTIVNSTSTTSPSSTTSGSASASATSSATSASSSAGAKSAATKLSPNIQAGMKWAVVSGILMVAASVLNA